MPSPRRLRLVFVATLVAVVFILIYTSNLQDRHPRDTRSFQDFYQKTMHGMSKQQQAVFDTSTGATAGRIPADKDADGDVDEDDRRVGEMTKQRLRAAEQMAKDKANEKALRPDPPSQVVGMGSSAEGQERKAKAKAVAEAPAPAESKSNAPPQVSQEELKAEQELNAILKRAPIVIFSKTYCPYSKHAKDILLEKYSIVPAPYVVELDQHPQGKALQTQLSRATSRSTVPNIMVAGISIGGNDEVVDLVNRDQLASKIRNIAGKQVEIKERFAAASDKGKKRSV
ncbi:hypothetical protein CDD81_5448 [Ophiocordyceps australis]|uniref:Glutaredoxin domain-containing protein n=1 Tax=Ophiocordyceps australis TaxID=1399860 RepID=A0A2C5YA88_9HYPO|nr:hypothetical protein CDD81_5448 [Ophiocordyceps australis]